MHPIQIEFESYIQAQEYEKADCLIESLLSQDHMMRIDRKDALQLLYRIGYVYPQLTLELAKQRNDIPRPFIDTLNISLGNVPPFRFYKGADTLVAIKIALLKQKPLIAKLLVNRFYKQFKLQPISLVSNNRLTIGNNRKKIKKTSNNSKVSIIVTTYNSERFIDNCLRSLLNQSLSNTEIIVVDDASTDKTSSIIANYPAVKLIKLKENKGTYFARNIGIEHATGEFITFQDSDDWSHPERLDHQLSQLVENPNTLVNFSKFFRVNEISGLPDCRQKYPLLRLNLSSMMTHKKIITDLGGFDANRRIESDKALLQNFIECFGEASVTYLNSPLAIGLLRNNSLTTSRKSGFNKYGYSAHRILY